MNSDSIQDSKNANRTPLETESAIINSNTTTNAYIIDLNIKLGLIFLMLKAKITDHEDKSPSVIKL